MRGGWMSRRKVKLVCVRMMSWQDRRRQDGWGCVGRKEGNAERIRVG